MKTPASAKQVKRHRSFSNNRSKDSNKEETSRSSEEEEKGVGDSTESEKDREIRQQNQKMEKTEISRSSSPENFRSRFETGSEESPEDVGRNVDGESRLRLPSVTNADKAMSPAKKLSNEMCRFSRLTMNGDHDGPSVHLNADGRSNSYQPVFSTSQLLSHNKLVRSSLSAL
jgi:hypothetical protein